MTTFIAAASTNPQPDSVVQIQVEDLICSLALVPTSFGDVLPIIPTSSRVEDDKVLFQIQVKAHLIQRATGTAAANRRLSIVSSRAQDAITGDSVSDANGDLVFTLKTRAQGPLRLSSSAPGVTRSMLDLTIKDAWYESTFLITGYNVCDEGDFSGALVAASGLSENHKSDFLYSARGIPMQGTGRASDGRFVRLAGGLPGGWHRNAAGNPDVAANPDRVAFAYATAPIGAFGAVAENRSIAVDRRVIPPRALVDIDGVGSRIADDTGSAIRGYHIDNFLGAGQAVVTAWMRGALNGTQRKVKFIGRST